MNELASDPLHRAEAFYVERDHCHIPLFCGKMRMGIVSNRESEHNMKGIIGRVLIILVLLSALALTAYIATEKFMDDKARAEELARKEKLPPTLTLEGKDTVKVRQGKKFKEPGYSAVDAFGKDLTDQVEVDVPDLKERGTYTVRYHVADKRGNTAGAERTVKVDFPKQTEEGAARGLSVIMYHDVYDPEDLTVEVTPNKVSTATLEEELQFLVEEEYYFPTWKEVERYLNGKIDLPEKSVVLTFDDATDGFLKNGIPLLEKYDVHATSFVITSKKGKKIQKLLKEDPPRHVEFQSHSHDMHKSGGYIGHGGIMTALGHDEIVADLKKSQDILGTSDALAYPFGDYTEECALAVKDAGFRVAFTTQYGKIYPGNDPMMLPRMRSNGDISLETFKELL